MRDGDGGTRAGSSLAPGGSQAGERPAPDQVLEATREQLRRLREAMVKRTVQRATTMEGWTPDLRAHPDQFPPLIEGKQQFELQLLRLLVTNLLEAKAQLPLEAEALHRRLSQGANGGEYEQCLAALGMSSGPAPILARLCEDQLLEALQLQLGPRAGGGPRRLFITQIDRQGLARLAGVEDTAAVIRQTQQAQGMGMAGLPPGMSTPSMAAPPGMLPGLMQGPPGMMAMPQGGAGMQGMMPPGSMMMPSITASTGPAGLPGGMPAPGAPPAGPGPGFMAMQGQQPGGQLMGGPTGTAPHRPDSSDIDSLLSRRTARDRMLADRGGGAELEAVLARPTAREAAQLEAFRTAGGGSAIQEHCPHLTKEDCRRAHNSALACGRVHFRRIIRPHTDVLLGNCSYLNTCRNQDKCKYIHYDLDLTDDSAAGLLPHMAPPGPAAGAAQRSGVPKYLQALPQAQWIRCDIRTLDMKVLGKFGVIMADPPWQIHQDLPYGTMEDNEMRRMDIGCLQDDGVIFLWVTGRAMELGRECLKIWGYDRVDELIWVKTNQLNRLIRTGRTGHWLNHSKEHCLVGVKGKPVLNRYVDCDVLVAEVRETSRKPDEMYALLERLSPGTRKLEIFARTHNLTKGWVGLGNQLDGVNILDPDMRARFIARYGPEGPDGKLPVPT